MGKITIDEMSNSLKEYLSSMGITEERVIELINANISQDTEAKILFLENQITKLQQELVTVMIELELKESGNIDSEGVWYDTFTDANSVTYIEGLVLDIVEGRIYGAPGNVILNDINVPFSAVGVDFQVTLDNNFIDNIYEGNVEAGSTNISLNKYTYEFK